MTELVPHDEIEEIVGARRHDVFHLGRAVSLSRTVYILHPRSCLDEMGDLRDCKWSRALDNGIDVDEWAEHEDQPVTLGIRGGRGTPMRLVPAMMPPEPSDV